MWMTVRILGRLIKKLGYVLLIGWTPKPPEDFTSRLSAVETLARKLDKRLYRDGKAEEVAAEPLVTVPNLAAEPIPSSAAATDPVLRHSDGTPVRHGDSPH